MRKINVAGESLSEQEKEGGFILLNSPERTLRFSNINEVAVPSINRDFSAPIVLKTNPEP